MSGAGDKTDATVQLPDEVLSHVFSFLSLRDKLRSEAVNHKFQRCVHQELKANPQQLDYAMYPGQLNGYPVPPEGILGAMQTLAKKAKFSRISMLFWDMPGRVQQLDSVLSILISEAQCLSKVTSFATDCGCSQAVLEKFLDRCEKLSTVSLSFDVRSLNSESSFNSFPLDLPHLFKNRRFTDLQLCPILYPMKGLAQMFKEIQPNSLRKLDLRFVTGFRSTKPKLSIAELFDALSASTGSVLEHVHLVLRCVDIQFAPLFESLARLPVLHKCDIECEDLEGNGQVAQFVPAVTSLFNMSHVNISLMLHEFSFHYNFEFPPGCQFVTMIRQIQKVHPSMAVDIDPLHSLTLSLGNASVCIDWSSEGIEDCDDDDCALCPSFYPSLLKLLRWRAQVAAYDSVEAQHLPNWQVDRCKLDKVLDDLNNLRNPMLWRALSLEETDKQQAITIQFETDEEEMEHRLFSITVSCGQCLANGCIKCVD